jgi:hypothetical protein
MHELEVTVLDESRTVSTAGELGKAMGQRVNGGNHWMISSPVSPYPMLDVLVQDEYAALHYFVIEGNAGDQALPNLIDPPDEVQFPHSSQGDTIALPGSVLIDATTAQQCVHQFAETLARPTLVAWTAL